MNTAALNVFCTRHLVDMSMHSRARIPGVELLGYRAGVYLASVNKVKLFSKVTVPFWPPPATPSSGIATT